MKKYPPEGLVIQSLDLEQAGVSSTYSNESEGWMLTIWDSSIWLKAFLGNILITQYIGGWGWDIGMTKSTMVGGSLLSPGSTLIWFCSDKKKTVVIRARWEIKNQN